MKKVICHMMNGKWCFRYSEWNCATGSFCEQVKGDNSEMVVGYWQTHKHTSFMWLIIQILKNIIVIHIKKIKNFRTCECDDWTDDTYSYSGSAPIVYVSLRNCRYTVIMWTSNYIFWENTLWCWKKCNWHQQKIIYQTILNHLVISNLECLIIKYCYLQCTHKSFQW